ncbi:hypothetical protein [Xanthomonas phaseoli]|uniref:hypothetical protein n=1 Tax=Xanthomonas phaseoli TaxID=1985254 RepID=UPI001E2D1F5D|nr:hypothetical protein [Xanthomonas phaseoli]MCC8471844.1 hypothetical protein [Xanthomonas phaseoli]
MARSPGVLFSEITTPLAGLIALVVLRLKGRRNGTDTWRFSDRPSTNVSLADHLQISHPYLVRVVRCGEGFEVTLSDAFPAEFRVFELCPAAEVWTDYKEVESSLGLIEEDGSIFWLCGTGGSMEEAVEDALMKFINWAVHPAHVTANDFCMRPTRADDLDGH